MSELLRTEKLTRDFGALRAVNEVDFSVERGEVRSLIGSNGAGKSTFLDLVIHKTTPTAGKVLFDGEDITDLAPHMIVRRGMGRCFQISKFFPNLTVFENIQIPCIHNGNMAYSMLKSAKGRYKEQVQQLMEAVGIDAGMTEFAGKLLGRDVKFQISAAVRTLIHDRNLLFLMIDTAASAAADTLILILSGKKVNIFVKVRETEFDGKCMVLYN